MEKLLDTVILSTALINNIIVLEIILYVMSKVLFLMLKTVINNVKNVKTLSNID